MKYTVKIVCGDCGAILNESKPMTAKELFRNWTMIVMGSPLNAGKCPKGCRPTYSDCNLNTENKIFDAANNEVSFDFIKAEAKAEK